MLPSRTPLASPAQNIPGQVGFSRNGVRFCACSPCARRKEERVSGRLPRLRAGFSERCSVPKMLGEMPTISVSTEHTLRSLRLTVYLPRMILCPMPSRLALTVFVAVLALAVCCSSICLIPAGQGPFAAAYGPISIFQAQRAAARLVSCTCSVLSTSLGDCGNRLMLGPAGGLRLRPRACDPRPSVFDLHPPALSRSKLSFEKIS